MSTEQLERLLSSWRAGKELLPDGAVSLTVGEALAYRNAGNVPDAEGRSLRIILRVTSEEELATLEERRAVLEPDLHDPPDWRREGSRPVNVVPLRRADVKGSEQPWWEDPEMAALEREWQESGLVEGVVVPAEYRSFVYKTVVGLRRAGRPVTARTIGDSVERWLAPEDAAEVRRSLKDT